jgi:hypothetical protein
LIFVAVPSLILNIISLFWWLDDRLHRRKKTSMDFSDNLIMRERLHKLTNMKRPKKCKNIEVTEADFLPDLKASRAEMARWIAYTVFQVSNDVISVILIFSRLVR